MKELAQKSCISYEKGKKGMKDYDLKKSGPQIEKSIILKRKRIWGPLWSFPNHDSNSFFLSFSYRDLGMGFTLSFKKGETDGLNFFISEGKDWAS